MLTVPEAAALAACHPETIRRWIRSRKLRASKIGGRHLIEEGDLHHVIHPTTLPLPDALRRTATGEPMPDWVFLIRRDRVER